MKYFGGIGTGSILILAPNKSATTSIDGDNSATNMELQVMPNPATDMLKIELPTIDGKQTLKLYDITGRVVYNNEYNNSGNVEVNVSEFKRGVYYLSLENQTNSYLKKIIIN